MTHVKQRPSLREETPWQWRRTWRARIASWGATAGLCLAVSALALLTLSAAKAADLAVGGDCCADLEERIAELEATTARKGNRKVALTVYGQVNAGVLYFDPDVDGVENDLTVINNQSSESRFGFKGDAKINSEWSAGFRIELGLDQKGSPWAPAGADDIVIRHAYWTLKSEQIGGISVGQTSTATDDIDSISTSNRTAVTKLLSVEPVGSAWLGGFQLPFDGGRDNVVRYDSPTLAGFKLTAAWMGDTGATDDAWDVALRYAGEFGEFRVAGGVGYANDGAIDLGLVAVPVDTDRITVSGSLMHTPSGLFVDGMYAKLEIDSVDIDVHAWHVLGGIEARLNAMGKTTLFGEFAQVDIDAGPIGDLQPSWYGLGVVQAVDAAAMDLYIQYRKYDLDVDGGPDPQSVVAGARIAF